MTTVCDCHSCADCAMRSISEHLHTLADSYSEGGVIEIETLRRKLEELGLTREADEARKPYEAPAIVSEEDVGSERKSIAMAFRLLLELQPKFIPRIHFPHTDTCGRYITDLGDYEYALMTNEEADTLCDCGAERRNDMFEKMHKARLDTAKGKT